MLKSFKNSTSAPFLFGNFTIIDVLSWLVCSFSKSLITKNLVLAKACPACRHEYQDETQLCPECGAVRPMVVGKVE